ncbi:hypothetical protein ACFWFU_35770, partial [Streptomyces sp. NPDC060235]
SAVTTDPATDPNASAGAAPERGGTGVRVRTRYGRPGVAPHPPGGPDGKIGGGGRDRRRTDAGARPDQTAPTGARTDRLLGG